MIATRYKKLDHSKLSNEKFETKEYLKIKNIHDSRLIFQSKTKMMKTVKMNFKNNPQFIKDNWSCSGCTRLDSQEHLLYCDGYAHLRDGLHLDSDEDLAVYYRKIIQIRNKE